MSFPNSSKNQTTSRSLLLSLRVSASIINPLVALKLIAISQFSDYRIMKIYGLNVKYVENITTWLLSKVQ